MKKHVRTIKNAAKSMKRRLRKWKHKQNRTNKKLYKCKYKNILKATQKFERLINDTNVDKEKLFYEAVNKLSNRKSTLIPPIRNPKTYEILATTDKEISNTLHKYYCQPLKRNEYEPKHKALHTQFIKNHNTRN